MQARTSHTHQEIAQLLRRPEDYSLYEAYLAKGESLFWHGHHEEARPLLKKALDFFGSNVEEYKDDYVHAMNACVLNLNKLNEYHSSQKILSNSLQYVEHFSLDQQIDFYFQLASVLEKAGLYEDSIYYFVRIEEFISKHSFQERYKVIFGLANLHLIQFALEKYEFHKAESYLPNAEKYISPDDWQYAQVNLSRAVIAAAQANDELVIQFAEKAYWQTVESENQLTKLTNLRSLQLLSNAHYQLKNWVAVQYYSKVGLDHYLGLNEVELGEDILIFHCMSGVACEKLKFIEEADAHFGVVFDALSTLAQDRKEDVLLVFENLQLNDYISQSNLSGETKNRMNELYSRCEENQEPRKILSLRLSQ